MAININGVDWSSRITKIDPIIGESKRVQRNLRGEETTIPSRSKAGMAQVQISIPFCTVVERDYLFSLMTQESGIELTHDMDFQTGTFTITDVQAVPVKSEDTILFDVKLVLSDTDNPVSPSVEMPSVIAVCPLRLGV